MDQILKSLRFRGAAIEERIRDELARPAPDSLRLQALKKLKLQFRDQIDYIERLNRRGEVKSIPVVHRRNC
jgi:hypothetical protein